MPGELDLLLRGLFELTITCAQEDATRRQTRALATRVDGDPDAMSYRDTAPGERP
jgi:hypothetical protein